MLDWHICQICYPLEIKLLLLLLLMLYCKIIIAVLNIPNMCLESKKHVLKWRNGHVFPFQHRFQNESLFNG